MINYTAEQRAALLAIIELLPAALGLEEPVAAPPVHKPQRPAERLALPPLRPEPLDTPVPLPEYTDGPWRTHYRVREVATALQLPVARVQALCRDGQLEKADRGLITRASLARYLRGERPTAPRDA